MGAPAESVEALEMLMEDAAMVDARARAPASETSAYGRSVDRYAIPGHWSRYALLQRSVCRWLPAAILASVAAFPRVVDGAVGACWAGLYGTRWAHAPMFEAWTATLGFAGAIMFWSSAHLLFFRDSARANTFRWDGNAPAAPFEWLGQLGLRRFIGAWTPLIAYVGSIKLFHCVVSKAPLPLNAPTALRVLGELALGVFAYDAGSTFG